MYWLARDRHPGAVATQSKALRLVRDKNRGIAGEIVSGCQGTNVERERERERERENRFRLGCCNPAPACLSFDDYTPRGGARGS